MKVSLEFAIKLLCEFALKLLCEVTFNGFSNCEEKSLKTFKILHTLCVLKKERELVSRNVFDYELLHRTFIMKNFR